MSVKRKAPQGIKADFSKPPLDLASQLAMHRELRMTRRSGWWA